MFVPPMPAQTPMIMIASRAPTPNLAPSTSGRNPSRWAVLPSQSGSEASETRSTSNTVARQALMSPKSLLYKVFHKMINATPDVNCGR